MRFLVLSTASCFCFCSFLKYWYRRAFSTLNAVALFLNCER